MTGLICGVALLLFAPSAIAATFTVNNTGDDFDAGSVRDGVCDTDTMMAGLQCSLRAATQEANDETDVDMIDFEPALFTGDASTSTIDLTGAGPAVSQPATVDGGDCDATSAFKPCVGVDAGGGAFGFIVTSNVEIRGLAVSGGSTGIIVTGSNTTIAGNWLGLRLDQTAQGSGRGVELSGEGSDLNTIGGETAADRNVFAHHTGDGLRITGGDGNVIKGNYFGTKPDGTTAAPNGGLSGTDNIEVSSIGGTANPASNNVIGGTQSTAQLASPECDGPCNVIANSSDGVDLETEGGSDGSSVSTTTIKGNFIGLDRTGQTAAPNLNRGIRASTSSITNSPLVVGGPDPGDRNVIAGNAQGGLQAAGGMTVQNNYFGSNSQGDAAIPNLGTVIGDATVGAPSNPSTMEDNRFAGNGVSGGRVFIKGETTVLGNSFGIGTGGQALAPAGTALTVDAGTGGGNSDQIGGSGPGDANTIGNVGGAAPGILISGGDDNEVLGNLIGVTANGTAAPNSGPGIRITNFGTEPALNNTIGGGTQAEENVISNSGTDAIDILDDESSGAVSNDGNTVLRNRGQNNGSTAFDLFIDLRTDIAGNGSGNPPAGPNAGIGEPLPEEPITTEMTGSGSASNLSAGNEIRVFKTFAETNDDVRGFAAQTTVAGDGTWTATFSPPLPNGQCLSATETDAMGNTSELAQPSFSVGPDPCDVTGPTITIDTGPSGTTNDPTADFGFSSEAGAIFECRVDGAPFAPCDDPSGPTGAESTAPLSDGPHTFDVRGTDVIGNLGPVASRSFTVDTTPAPPVVTPPALTTPPAAPAVPAKKCKKKKRKRRGAAAAKRCKKKKKKKR